MSRFARVQRWGTSPFGYWDQGRFLNCADMDGDTNTIWARIGSGRSSTVNEISTSDFSIIRSRGYSSFYVTRTINQVGGNSSVLWVDMSIGYGRYYVEISTSNLDIIRTGPDRAGEAYNWYFFTGNNSTLLQCVQSQSSSDLFIREIGTDFSLIRQNQTDYPVFGAMSYSGGSTLWMTSKHSTYDNYSTLQEIDPVDYSVIRFEKILDCPHSETAGGVGGDTNTIWWASGRWTHASDSPFGTPLLRMWELGSDLNYWNTWIETYHSYVITNIMELQAMMGDNSGNYVIAVPFIDASETASWEWEDSTCIDGSAQVFTNFIPIGSSDGGFYCAWWNINKKDFNGSLNGNNCRIINLYSKGMFYRTYNSNISNITLENPTSYGNGGFIGDRNGWFGSPGGHISNVHLKNSIVSPPSGGAAGFIAYENRGTIYNCSVSGDVISVNSSAYGFVWSSFGGSISRCFANCNVTSSATGTSRACGFFGTHSAATIRDCYCRGTINLNNTTTGWACGFGLSSSYYSGNDWIYRSYSSSFINTTGNKYGFLQGSDDPNRIINCFWDIGNAGTTESAAGIGKTSIEMLQMETFSDASWGISVSTSYQNAGYPFLAWELGESSPTWRIFDTVSGNRGVFVRDNEIHAVDGIDFYRSPDFGATWYKTELSRPLFSLSFDARNYHNSMLGSIDDLYVFSNESNNKYLYTEGDVASGVAVDIYCDLKSNVSIIGTTESLYKTLKYGVGGTRVFLNEPVTAVSIGGSYVINPQYSFVSYETTDGSLMVTDSSYSTAHNSTEASEIIHDESSIVGQLKDGDYSIYRFGLVFNTTNLPDDSILSAFIRFYVADIEADESFNLQIQGSENYPSAPLSVGDYNKTYYTGHCGEIASSKLEVNRSITINLNSTGLGLIQAGGQTRFILRTNREIAGTVPTGNEFVKIYQAEKGSYYVPKLFVKLQTV